MIPVRSDFLLRSTKHLNTFATRHPAPLLQHITHQRHFSKHIKTVSICENCFPLTIRPSPSFKKLSAPDISNPSKPRLQHIRSGSSLSAKMTKGEIVPITTKAAFPAAGPYTQAFKLPTQGLIFVSGQIPGDPSGQLVTGSIAAQTAACIENIKAILAEANSDISRVVKCTVFLTDASDFDEMNKTYEEYFAHKPARSCVTVKALPKGVPVEIECIALV